MTKDYRIVRIGEDDLEAWWRLRLMALRTSPDAFGTSYADAIQQDPVMLYRDRGVFGDGPQALFAAFTSDGSVVAQSATYADSGTRSHIAYAVSVFTHPDHRQQGLARALVTEAMEYIGGFPHITSVRISVNSTNLAAKHLYETLGFVTWGEEPDAIRSADGSCHNECHMVLRNRS